MTDNIIEAHIANLITYIIIFISTLLTLMPTDTLDLLWTISTQGMTQIVKKIQVTGWVNNTCIPHSTIMTQLFKNSHYPFSNSNITVYFFIIQSMPTVTAIYIHEYKKYCWFLPFWDFEFQFQLLRYRFPRHCICIA